MNDAAPDPALSGAHRDGGDARGTTVKAMTPSPPDSSLPALLRAFHERLPLAGDPLTGLLSLPDDQVLYLIAILRDTPIPAPAMTPEEWQGFLDLLRPHGVYPLLAYRLRAWPADCRPPAEVMDQLNRVFLYAAARSMRAGRQIQAAVDALEADEIISRAVWDANILASDHTEPEK